MTKNLSLNLHACMACIECMFSEHLMLRAYFMLGWWALNIRRQWCCSVRGNGAYQLARVTMRCYIIKESHFHPFEYTTYDWNKLLRSANIATNQMIQWKQNKNTISVCVNSSAIIAIFNCDLKKWIVYLQLKHVEHAIFIVVIFNFK